MAEVIHPGAHPRPRKSLILCFDGTGNKFQGTQADSNIVKIYNLLDRQDDLQYHYYQPGIGTYVETSSLSHKSRFGRIKSAYIKAKDQAIGTSFGEHVMAGYKFLMRYYSDGDAIYFFGFSRGSYTARFLAQMLDYVGLLSAGNEEMLRFAWKTFSGWQMRTEENAEEKHKKKETYEFMQKFRETFSRPVCRIEFIGLFDCVNSVPQFESAWMSRTKFPYTAKTSARVIRHAVSIDERRAKFRQDLVSEQRDTAVPDHVHHHSIFHEHQENEKQTEGGEDEPHPEQALKKRPTMKERAESRFRPNKARKQHLDVERPLSMTSQVSVNSATIIETRKHEDHDSDDDDDDHQDILEVWFAGQHGDIGGGWTLHKDEDRPLSDIALMWMIQEARRAGMPFDESKLSKSNLVPPPGAGFRSTTDTPALQLDGQPLQPPQTEHADAFEQEIHRIATRSHIHDSLKFGGGLGFGATLAWTVMEYMPFRRMDLQPDGSWKPISLPLPRGEVRDMPDTCIVHHSVLKRMEADPTYRPGNLIVGGGGRGVRIATEEQYKKAHWDATRDKGDLIGEAYNKIGAKKDSPGAVNGS